MLQFLIDLLPTTPEYRIVFGVIITVCLIMIMVGLINKHEAPPKEPYAPRRFKDKI